MSIPASAIKVTRHFLQLEIQSLSSGAIVKNRTAPPRSFSFPNQYRKYDPIQLHMQHARGHVPRLILGHLAGRRCLACVRRIFIASVFPFDVYNPLVVAGFHFVDSLIGS